MRIACLLLATVLPLAAADGVLGEVKRTVSPPSGRSSSSPSSSDHGSNRPGRDRGRDHGHDRHEEGGWLNLFFWVPDEIDVVPAYEPSAEPPPLFAASMLDVGFRKWPYWNGDDGWFSSSEASDDVRPSAAQVWSEWGRLDAGFNRFAMGGRWWITPFIQAEGEWNRYFERLADGGRDTLTVGWIGLGGGGAINDRLHLRLRLGEAFLHTGDSTASGPYIGVGIDGFPARPLVLSAQTDIGLIRVDEFSPETVLSSWRATGGAMLWRMEFYLGWQGVRVETITMDGPVAGMRAWF
jgi:hypothetical protein